MAVWNISQGPIRTASLNYLVSGFLSKKELIDFRKTKTKRWLYNYEFLQVDQNIENYLVQE